MSNPPTNFVPSPGRSRVLILGDVMLHRYDSCDRRSSGPIPSLRTTRQDDRLGGAAQVAAMLPAVDVEVILAGVVGADDEGRLLTELAARAAVDCCGLVVDPGRPTALRQRFIACDSAGGPHLVFQVDRISDQPLPPQITAELLTRIEQVLPQIDRLIISGHGSGIYDTEVVPWVVDLAHARGIPVVTSGGNAASSEAGSFPKARHRLPAARRVPRATHEKIIDVAELLPELQQQRQNGRSIVMTNGCFDLLHPGHVASLEAARRQGDCLVVGLNSDRSVRALKGPQRPMIDQQGRAEILAALACVDYVVIFDDTSVAGLVAQVLPDVLVKSAEYSLKQVVGHEIVQRHGGRVVQAPMKSEYSTTRLIETMEKIENPLDDDLLRCRSGEQG